MARRVGAVAGLVLLGIPAAPAQELAPRTFWPAPEGTQVAVFGYSHSFGNVLVDTSLPISGVASRIHTGFLAYMQTFNLAGRTANFLLEQPYSWGTTSGEVSGTPARRNYSGLNDLGLSLAINLIGAPSMTGPEFQRLRANPQPILGTSIKVLAPTGQYDADSLINVGGNRWAVRPKLGVILPLRATWLLELEGSMWLFGDDEDYIAGRRDQDPVVAGEVHLVKRFKPGFWASLDTTCFAGGRQTIGGNRLDDEQGNVRLGGTLVVPFLGRNAIKAGYSAGIVTRYGNEFHQILMAYQRAF